MGTEYNPSLIFDLERFYGLGGGDRLIFLEGRIPTPKQRRSVRDEEFANQIPNGFEPDSFIGHAHIFHELLPITFTFINEPADMDSFRRSLRETYDCLPHHPLIDRILKDSRSRIGSESYTALHVRRGDNVWLLHHDLTMGDRETLPDELLSQRLKAFASRMAPYGSYYAQVEETIAAKQRIVFFSDSPETFEHFAQKFGAKNFFDASRLVKPRYPIQKAFIDFNLLVGASRIIGTSGSIYASFAAMLGAGRFASVAGLETPEGMERYLFDDCLRDIELGADIRARIELEFRRQYAEVQRAHMKATELPALPLK